VQLRENNIEDYADRRGLLLEFIGNTMAVVFMTARDLSLSRIYWYY